MKTSFSILHISDLHRIKAENIDCLMSSFEVEKSRLEEKSIPPIGLIVVSGDIVNGSNKDDAYAAKEEIQQQYAIASRFLNALCNLFIGDHPNDRLKVIIVPGNHDMSRYLSKMSMEKISHDDDGVGELVEKLWNGDTDIRWSWGNLHFYQIKDKEIYNKRFDDFIGFYNNFYQGLRTYPMDPDRQSELIDIPELNLSLACFNSCYHLDHLRQSGYISPRSLSQLTRQILRAKEQGRLVMGVWHHHTHGLPNENNYLDYSILENMVQNGITVALHGHQHICGIVSEYKDVFSDAKLCLISAGTLYGNSFDLPVGKVRQFNLLSVEMNDDISSITLFSREDKTALNEMPAWDSGVIGRSRKPSYTLPIKMPLINNMTDEKELQDKVNEINLFVEKTGEITEGITKLERLGTDIPLVRKFLLDYLMRIGNNSKICELFLSPQNLFEAISVIQCCIAIKDKKTFAVVLDSNFVRTSTDASLQSIITEAKFLFK